MYNVNAAEKSAAFVVYNSILDEPMKICIKIECTPKTGEVRLLRLTEKLYYNIYMVSGEPEPDFQEKVVGINIHIML